MCGSLHDPTSLLGGCFCCALKRLGLLILMFASCSFGLLCLLFSVTFQISGTFLFSSSIYNFSFSEDDLLILIMPFTLLFWYVGFPSAALTLSFQNLFVFLVSMPPARILLFQLPTWVFVYVLYGKHSYILHINTSETLKLQENVTLKRSEVQMFLEWHQQDFDLEVPV